MVSKRLVIWQSILFALLGIVLLYFSFRKTDFNALWQVIQQGNHWVILPVFFVSVWVMVARSLRWKILYKGANVHVPFNVLFASLASGYLVNFVVPRLGEITRALIVKRTLNVPVNTSLSTILFERITDLICLAMLLALAFGFEFINHGTLLAHFTNGVNLLSGNKILLLFVFVLCFAAFYFWLKKRNDKISTWIKSLLETSIQLTQMKNKWQFVFHTSSIWIGFYLMTYLWFFMFEDAAQLSAYDAFLIMALGVVARTLPIQAGSAGAYHFVVSQALALLGINMLTGNALAIVIHGFQTILTLLFGFCAYLWLLYYNKQNAEKNIA